jgi:hypothetical protein
MELRVLVIFPFLVRFILSMVTIKLVAFKFGTGYV